MHKDKDKTQLDQYIQGSGHSHVSLSPMCESQMQIQHSCFAPTSDKDGG